MGYRCFVAVMVGCQGNGLLGFVAVCGGLLRRVYDGGGCCCCYCCYFFFLKSKLQCRLVVVVAVVGGWLWQGWINGCDMGVVGL